jgi:hypothetical protein
MIIRFQYLNSNFRTIVFCDRQLQQTSVLRLTMERYCVIMVESRNDEVGVDAIHGQGLANTRFTRHVSDTTDMLLRD